MIGPTAPFADLRLSTSRTGVTSAAVPVKNTSSASQSWSRVMRHSSTGMPSSRASVRIVSRVMPSRIEPRDRGVWSTPFFTMKMFSPEPSLT